MVIYVASLIKSTRTLRFLACLNVSFTRKKGKNTDMLLITEL